MGQLYIPGAKNAPEEEFNEALATFGLVLCDPDQTPEEECYLWPENVRTYNIWHRIQTQWRVGGMGERTGLDYAAVSTHLRQVERVRPGRQTLQVWSALQAMEAAALQAWAEKREQQAN